MTLIRTSLKTLGLAALGLSMASLAAAQETVATQSPFNWDAAAGKMQLVQHADLMQKILSGETVSGSFRIDDCHNNGKFEPGFRLVLQTADQMTSVFPGFTCVPETGEVFAGQSSIIKDGVHPGLQHADFVDWQIGKLGDDIDFSIWLDRGRMNISVGETTAIYPAFADFNMAFFAVVASEGSVVFDREPSSLG